MRGKAATTLLLAIVALGATGCLQTPRKPRRGSQLQTQTYEPAPSPSPTASPSPSSSPAPTPSSSPSPQPTAAPNPTALRLTPDWVQPAVLSTWRSSIPNGWYPKLSKNGRYLIFGNGAAYGADLQTGVERAIGGGRAFGASWIGDTQFTYFDEIVDNQASRRYVGSSTDWIPVATGDDPYIAHGGMYGADAGNWASWSPGGGFKLVRNGQIIATGVGGALAVGGNQIANAQLVNGEYRGVMVWTNGALQAVYPTLTPQEAHQIAINKGYVVYGGYGPVHGILPNGTDIDVTTVPWQWEGSPVVFFVGAQPWIATATFSGALQRGYVLLRPFGEKGVIVLDDGAAGTNHLDTDAISISVVENAGILTIATNDPKGRMQVRKIPVNAPRHILQMP
ncbi:MAG TPA: hypothetical protein VM598_05680 [Bdellovibrionota bacterium]|nr:hypothetical protein [Bdellovibrionota bacterium]